MLKKEIKYTTFDDEEVSDIFYFNISKAELVELQVDYVEGFDKAINRIVEAEDTQKLIKEFKSLVLFSYGEKSPDGKRFIKNDQLREEFAQSAAYSELFMQLATNANAASEFINSVIPKGLGEALDQDKPNGPPPAPIAPIQNNPNL